MTSLSATLVPLTALMLVLGGASAWADPSVGTIGPGPSSNTAGVVCIQTTLQDVVQPPLEIDGEYGQATYDAVKVFQAANGLSPDGAVGPETGELLAQSAPAGCDANLPTIGRTPPVWS